MSHILIFRPGALGDTLLAFPALAALGRVFAGARLVAIGNAPALGLARAAGLVDEAWSFDLPQWADLFREEGIRSLEARSLLAISEHAILWMRDPDSVVARNLRASGVPRIVSAPGRPPEGERVHATDYLLLTLAGWLNDEALAAAASFTLASEPAAQRWVEDEWRQRGLSGAPVLALHPGSGGRHKCWPAERFVGLAGRFIAAGWRVLVIEGPADEAPASQVMQGLPPEQAQRLSGLSLSQLAAVLARVALYIGNDSGVTHLGALVGAPTLALFGPTDPVIWGPRGPRVQIVGPGPAFAGAAVGAPMTALHVEEVWAAAQRLLAR